MSEQYRGEGLGFYYTRLQAQREQRQKALEQSQSRDSSTQIGALTQPGTIDNVVQTEIGGATTPNIDQSVGVNQTVTPSTSDQSRPLLKQIQIESETYFLVLFFGPSFNSSHPEKDRDSGRYPQGQLLEYFFNQVRHHQIRSLQILIQIQSWQM